MTTRRDFLKKAAEAVAGSAVLLSGFTPSGRRVELTAAPEPALPSPRDMVLNQCELATLVRRPEQLKRCGFKLRRDDGIWIFGPKVEHWHWYTDRCTGNGQLMLNAEEITIEQDIVYDEIIVHLPSKAPIVKKKINPARACCKTDTLRLVLHFSIWKDGLMPAITYCGHCKNRIRIRYGKEGGELVDIQTHPGHRIWCPACKKWTLIKEGNDGK